MASFAYEIRDVTGGITSGTMSASNLSEAERMLRREGGQVISLHPADDSQEIEPISFGGNKKIKRDDVIYFATQLAVMVDTGVTLTEALDSIAQQSEHPGMKALLQEVSEDVKAGVEFSTALEKHQKVFGTLFVSLMRASEASGTMGQMLQRVSEYLEQERETIKRIKGAMTYPLCMLSFCVVIVICLLIFVLPRFEKIYAGKSAILPAPTRALLTLSHVLVDYWPYIIVSVIGSAVGLYFYLRTPAGKSMMDSLRIRIPLLGPLYRKACLARSLRSMATMVSSGVSMLEGLDITSRVAGNEEYCKMWDDVSERVKEGCGLSDQLYECDLIPRNIAQMIDAGERTGKLGTVMNRVAKFCEDDLKVAVSTLTSMIEPIMIVIMGLIVGGIAMALLLPVFRLSKVVAG